MAIEKLDLSKIPAQPPPPGVIPNFVDPPSRAGTLIAATATLLTLSTIFVLLRCYTRLVLVRKFGLGDYLLLLGYLDLMFSFAQGFAVANSALSMKDTTRGFGRHAWDVTLGDIFPHLAKSLWWQIKVYIMSLECVKLAILCLFYELSPFRNYRAYVWAIVALVTGCSISAVLWSTVGCLPVRTAWTFELAVQNKCPLKIDFIAFTGASNIATDLAILILPIVIIRRMTLPVRKKIGVGLVLASGSLASLISVVRMVISIRTFSNDDATWSKVNLILWSTSELHVTVICGCLPTLRPFVRRYFPTYLGGATTASSRSEPEQAAIELEKNKRKSPDELNSDSTVTSWALEYMSKRKEGQGSQNRTSEDEHILREKQPALSEREVGTVSRGQSAGTDIGQAV